MKISSPALCLLALFIGIEGVMNVAIGAIIKCDAFYVWGAADLGVALYFLLGIISNAMGERR